MHTCMLEKVLTTSSAHTHTHVSTIHTRSTEWLLAPHCHVCTLHCNTTHTLTQRAACSTQPCMHIALQHYPHFDKESCLHHTAMCAHCSASTTHTLTKRAACSKVLYLERMRARVVYQFRHATVMTAATRKPVLPLDLHLHHHAALRR